MSNYIKLTDFASKDNLSPGDPLKIVKGTEIDNEFEALETTIATKADITSPAFNGTPTALTAAAGVNTTQLATTAHVFAERSNTATLTNKTVNLTSNTLTGTTAQFNTALSDDNFATLTNTVTLTNKTLTSPTISDADLTGTPTAPTADTATDTTQVATTAFVQQEITANLATAGAGISITDNEISIASTSNGFGVRTISTSTPTGGSSGDIWYRVSA